MTLNAKKKAKINEILLHNLSSSFSTST